MFQIKYAACDTVTLLPVLEDFHKNFFMIAEKLHYPVVAGVNQCH